MLSQQHHEAVHQLRLVQSKAGCGEGCGDGSSTTRSPVVDSASAAAPADTGDCASFASLGARWVDKAGGGGGQLGASGSRAVMSMDMSSGRRDVKGCSAVSFVALISTEDADPSTASHRAPLIVKNKHPPAAQHFSGVLQRAGMRLDSEEPIGMGCHLSLCEFLVSIGMGSSSSRSSGS